MSFVYAKQMQYNKSGSTGSGGIGIYPNITKILFLIGLHSPNNIVQDKT